MAQPRANGRFIDMDNKGDRHNALDLSRSRSTLTGRRAGRDVALKEITEAARASLLADESGRDPGRQGGQVADQIEVKNVSFEYQVDNGRVLAIKEINFSVRQSEFLCLLGPSGCGKTTILNILAGLLRPTRGEVRIDGAPLDKHRQNRGVVFQDFAQLFPWRTARHNIEFGLEMRGIDKSMRRKIATEYLQLVGLEQFGDVFPHQLSGGMQQRVAIARSLAYNPQVLLMDEPFAALDAMTRDDMQQSLTDIWQKTKKTIVYITHNVAEAIYLGDRVIVLNAHPGTIKAELTLDLPRPRDALSESFVAVQREIMRNLRH
jgi:NitT/TauT family transport system ATP-binding protein